MQYVVTTEINGHEDAIYGPYRNEERAERIKEKIIEAFAREGGQFNFSVHVKPVEPWIER